MIELTVEEKRAISAFKRLAKKWPETLWCFSGGQQGIAILKLDVEGQRATTGVGEGFDHEYVVATVDMPTEGGDW